MFDNRFDAFKENSVFRNAACMCILQIGELCKVVSDELREEESKIPWREWCGIRDIFAHQYFTLDYDSAWDTIQHDLPELESELQRIIKENTRNIKDFECSLRCKIMPRWFRYCTVLRTKSIKFCM